MPDEPSRETLMAILDDVIEDVAQKLPLHVRVAMALGCKVKEHYAPHPVYPGKIEGPLVNITCGCGKHGTERTTDNGECEWDSEFARYDTDWSATGPLLEKYGITLECIKEEGLIVNWRACSHRVEEWTPGPDSRLFFSVNRAMPLLAVCELIIALHAAGRLKAA